MSVFNEHSVTIRDVGNVNHVLYTLRKPVKIKNNSKVYINFIFDRKTRQLNVNVK